MITFKKLHYNSVSFLLLSCIIAAVIGVGIYFYQKNKEGSEVTAISRPQTTITLSNTINNEPTWKIFKDEKYGFEFKYPASLGKIIDQPTRYQQKLDCTASSGYDKVIASKSIEGMGVEISCNYDFEKNAKFYIKNINAGEGSYEIIDNNGKKNYFFDYVSGTGYINKELYIPFLNDTYITLIQSYKVGESMEDVELTLEQYKEIISSFKIIDVSSTFFTP